MDNSPEMRAALTAYHTAEVAPNSGTRESLEARLRAVLDTYDCVECDIYCLSIADLQDRNRELTRQVEQLRNVLGYYAEPKNWRMNEHAVVNVLEMLPNGLGPAWKPAANALAGTAPPSSSDPGRNDSKGIEGDTGREGT